MFNLMLILSASMAPSNQSTQMANFILNRILTCSTEDSPQLPPTLSDKVTLQDLTRILTFSTIGMMESNKI